MITSELRTDGGRTFVVKRADPASAIDAARLTQEATVLAMARHPGVVELAEADEPVDPAAPLELRTIFAGARTLAAGDLDLRTTARALAVAAGTVADLHALGLVHGRLDPDHIVLTGSGRAVLCGFAEAGLAGDLRPDGEVRAPSLDVASLGALLQRGLTDVTSRPVARRAGIDRAAAAHLADRATAADPTQRPSARAFAVGLAACLPAPPARRRPRPELPVDRSALPPPPAAPVDPRPVEPAPPPRPRHRHRPARRVLAVTGGVIAMVSLGIGVDALADLPTGHGAAPAATTPASDPAPIDGPAPSDPVQSGGQLQIDGRHLSLGTADDQVLHAVWGCTGPDTVVLVRPDGSVFRFDRLATPGQDVTGTLIGRVPERSTVQVVDGPDGCLLLQARAGDRVDTLEVPSPPPSPTPA